MANIFEAVAGYYQRQDWAEPILPQATLERYFRRLLWRGKTQEELAELLDLVVAGIDHIDQLALDGFEDFEAIDWRTTVEVCLMNREEEITEGRVHALLQELQAFLVDLFPAEKEELAAAAKEAEDSYYINGKFFAEEELDDDDLAFLASMQAGEGDPFEGLAPEDVDAIVSGLFTRIQMFFRAEEYHADLQRAMVLYFGPVQMMADAPEDAAAIEHDLQAFWDFFLFDYHMIATDRRPLRVFFDAEKAELDAGQLTVLRDLLQSAFTIFYIERIEGDTAICRTLFTDEMMELPRPEAHGQDPKKTLLYGHVHAGGVMLLNYITIVPATAALRRRIQQEIERLYAIYKIQAPKADIGAFFDRHAAAVRHVIERMTSYAQLTVVPELPHVRALKASDVPAPLQPAVTRLGAHMKALGFSVYEQAAVQRLYRDAVQLLGPAGADESAFLAAVTLYFAMQNGKGVGNVFSFFELYAAEKDAVADALTKLFYAFNTEPPDPRYLTELGFVHLLFPLPSIPVPEED